MTKLIVPGNTAIYLAYKSYIMNSGKKQVTTGGKTRVARPEIRDDMDSRENKEKNYKSANNKKGVKPNTKAKNKAGN